MRAARTTLLVAWLGVFLTGGFARALEVKLSVEETAGVARTAEPVTSGVPFAKGALKDVSALTASVGGKPVPAQFLKTVPWPDGSVRWALLDTQVDVPAGGKVELVVSDGGKALAPAAPVKVDDGAEAVKVSAGPLEFAIGKKKFALFDSLKVDGKELIAAGGRGLVLVKADGAEQAAEGAPDKVEIEQAGPMRAIVCVRGKFPGVHNNLLQYTVRVTAYAGKKHVKVHVWLENQGGYGYAEKAEWFNFKGLAIEQNLALGDGAVAACEGATAPKLRVEQKNPGADWKGFAFTVTEGDKELKKGDRTGGLVALAGPGGKVAAGIRHFWEQYEKAIEFDGKALKLWLWPADGQWPRAVDRGYLEEREFGEFKKPKLYALPGAVHKGFECLLDCSGRDARESGATLSAPLFARATPLYYAETEAAPGWFAPADFAAGKADYDAKVVNWNRQAHNAIDPKEPSSLIVARQGGADGRGFWHGWMDFGDNLWAEGYSSLHYDWTWIMLLNYLRQGDAGFLEMGTTMARHRIDVDQIWSDKVHPAFRGLTRYEKGFTDVHGGVKDGYYKAIPSHNWISGVVLYYMLTGEPKAYECALRNAMGLELRQVNPFKDKPNAGDQPRSTTWTILALCSVYDLTADKKYLDQAMLLFKNNVAEKWKKDGPFLGNDALQYYYSVHPLCELHVRTGDEEILKLLKEGTEAPFPKPGMGSIYGEWKIHLTNLFAYVGYRTNNPELIKKAEQLFVEYISGDKSPACYTTNGAWDKETGKTIRNGHILQYVEWKLKTAGK